MPETRDRTVLPCDEAEAFEELHSFAHEVYSIRDDLREYRESQKLGLEERCREWLRTREALRCSDG